jgi:hypothetical protein
MWHWLLPFQYDLRHIEYIAAIKYKKWRAKCWFCFSINIFMAFISMYINIKKKLRGLSPQANYTDRATATVGEVVPTLQVEGVTWSVQWISTAVNLVFLDWSRYFFFLVAPQL